RRRRSQLSAARRQLDLGVLQRPLELGNAGRVAIAALSGGNLLGGVAPPRTVSRPLDDEAVVFHEQRLAVFDVVRLGRGGRRQRQGCNQKRKCTRHARSSWSLPTLRRQVNASLLTIG